MLQFVKDLLTYDTFLKEWCPLGMIRFKLAATACSALSHFPHFHRNPFPKVSSIPKPYQQSLYLLGAPLLGQSPLDDGIRVKIHSVARRLILCKRAKMKNGGADTRMQNPGAPKEDMNQ